MKGVLETFQTHKMCFWGNNLKNGEVSVLGKLQKYLKYIFYYMAFQHFKNFIILCKI